MEFINAGWFGILAGAVISIVTGVIFYRKSIRAPLLCYFTEVIPVVIHGPKEVVGSLKVVYHDKPVDTLTAVTITLWNGGNAVLEGASVVQLDPLRFECGDDGRFIGIDILADPNGPCRFGLHLSNENPNVLKLTFDYMDASNGFAVRLLHTSKKMPVVIKGTLKGCAIEDTGLSSFPAQQLLNSLLALIVTFGVFSLLFLLMILFASELLSEPRIRPMAMTTLAVFCAVGVVIWITASITRVAMFKLKSIQVPSQLRARTAPEFP